MAESFDELSFTDDELEKFVVETNRWAKKHRTKNFMRNHNVGAKVGTAIKASAYLAIISTLGYGCVSYLNPNSRFSNALHWMKYDMQKDSFKAEVTGASGQTYEYVGSITMHAVGSGNQRYNVSLPGRVVQVGLPTKSVRPTVYEGQQAECSIENQAVDHASHYAAGNSDIEGSAVARSEQDLVNRHIPERSVLLYVDDPHCN